ncbi:hypothetical protein FACS189499_10580 [Clostridia bacterium]|nr:hypothetical protein FACS189499_10580 [Clostridia bacterium]
MANYTYNWSVNPDGTPGVQFTYFKIHARKDYTWIHPVHECLNYIGGRVESKVFADITLNHFPDQEKSRGSYLPLLELAVAETPNEPRMLYYLGREYMYKKKWEECVSTLEKYLTLSQWDDERSAAMRWIAAAHRFSGDVPAAFRWYLRAIAEQPVIRDGYIELAETARNITPPDWKTVFWAAESALAIPERSKTFTNMPYSWNHTPYDLASLACFYLGLIDKAEDYARKAAERAPGDERICNNLTLIRNTYR